MIHMHKKICRVVSQFRCPNYEVVIGANSLPNPEAILAAMKPHIPLTGNFMNSVCFILTQPHITLFIPGGHKQKRSMCYTMHFFPKRFLGKVGPAESNFLESSLYDKWFSRYRCVKNGLCVMAGLIVRAKMIYIVAMVAGD